MKRPHKHIRHYKSGRCAVVNPEVPEKQKREIIKSYQIELLKDLKKEDRARMKDFGIFKLKKVKAKPARMGINPFTGLKQKFKAKPASVKVKFYPAKHLKQEIM